jgi:hypothetical protein
MKIPLGTKSELRQFSWLMTIFLLCLMVYFFFKNNTIHYSLIIPILVFGLIASFYPKACIIIYTPVMIVSHLIGKVNAVILLTLIYLIVFTLYRIIFKISGFDPLQRVKKNSYWHHRQQPTTNLTKQF